MAIITSTLLVGLGSVLTYWLLFYEDTIGPDALFGKRVLITGASSGIGEQLALEYCRSGASVVLTARREKLLQEVTKRCRGHKVEGGVYEYVAADMSKKDEPNNVVKKAVKFLGGLDQVIVNHGLITEGRQWKGSQDDLKFAKQVMDINYHSYLAVASAALPHLEQSNGSLGVVSSIAGKVPSVYMETYAASKFAVTGFFSSLQEQFKIEKKNVSITIGTIGLVETDTASDVWLKMKKDFEVDTDKVRRMGVAARPRDCAAAIMKATTERKRELFFPPTQRGYLTTIIYAIWPEFLSYVRQWTVYPDKSTS